MARKQIKNTNDAVLQAISDLAMATGNGFEEMNQQFGKVHKEIVEVREDVHQIESLLVKDLERRMQVIEHRLGIQR